MAPLTLSAIKIAYKAETAYASGNGSIKYDMTAFIAGDVASLTVMNYPADAASLGAPQTERVQKKAIGRGANFKFNVNKGYKYKEFTYKQYVQNATWLTAAQQASNGSIPTSYVFHFEIPGIDGAMDYFDLFGCVLQKYDLTCNEDDFPVETLTFLYYDMKDSVAVTNLAGVAVTQPATHGTVALTIDSDSLITVTKSLKLTIDNTLLDKKVIGRYERMDPYMISRDAQLEAEYYDDLAAINGDSVTTNNTLKAISLVPISIDLGIGGTDAITITNMYVDEESFGEVLAEQEMVVHKATLKMGGDCAFSMA